MSTIANVWVPHNLLELVKLIDNYITTGELDYSKLAPDFPTGGVIINKDDLKTIYETGKGKVILRAKAEVDKNIIKITEIPYQVYVEPLIDQIKKLIMDNTIPDINNILNKSGRNNLLIEIECEKDPYKVLNQLYKNTDLQKNFSPNQFALIGKTPQLLNLKSYLDVFINHNTICIENEYKFDLQKAQDRLEIVNGLIKALEDIDNIINLIKQSDSSSHAVQRLIDIYQFTERQAKAIVDMKLGRLAKLEKIELEKEMTELKDTISNCLLVLEDKHKRENIFLERLRNFGKKYGTKRKTEVTHIDLAKTKEEREIEIIPPEKCVVVMTKNGNLKRIPATAFRAQRRGGKGVKTQEDITECVIRTNTIDSLMVFSNKGKMYRIIVNNIPEGTNTSKGTPAKALTEMGPDEEVQTIYSIYRETDAKYIMFITKRGIVKKTPLEEYINTKKSKGIGAINLKEGDELVAVTLVKNEDIILITKNGYGIRFATSGITPTGRASVGVKGMNVSEDDEVVAGLPIRQSTDDLAIFTSIGTGKRVKIADLPIQNRSGKGLKIHALSEGNGTVAAAQLVNDEDMVLVIGNKTSLCIKCDEIPIQGRTTLGVSVIKDNRLLNVSKV